jgi:hypothetical protein
MYTYLITNIIFKRQRAQEGSLIASQGWNKAIGCSVETRLTMKADLANTFHKGKHCIKMATNAKYKTVPEAND